MPVCVWSLVPRLVKGADFETLLGSLNVDLVLFTYLSIYYFFFPKESYDLEFSFN